MRKAREELLAGGAISSLGIYVERRHAPRRAQLHLDFSPGSIMPGIAWFVSEHILIAQFRPNLSGNVGQDVQADDGENATATEFGDLGEQRRAVLLLQGAAHVIGV